jgi:hypothetical protein
VFDYETKSSYTVRARTLDPGGLAFDKVFAISIAENPPAGETLLQDPFDDGGVTDGADPLDAAWYRATGTGLVDASVAARPDNGSNALFHKQTGNAGSAETVQLSYGASFPARTLAAVGDTVALSLTLRTADVYNNVTTIGNFGMGLWDGPALAANYGQGTGVAGYYHTASNLTVPASKFWKETGAVSSWPMHGTDTAQIGATGGFGIADNTTYTYTFTVTKTAAGVDITFSDGTNTQTVSDTSGAYTTFSRVHVGIGRRDLAENDVYLDDITVTFTPAP